MKAAVFEAVGTPLRVEEVRDPRPRAGEVLIKVAACGVCHSDLHVINGDLPFPLPTVLGHEASGHVVEVAPDVTNVKVGDPVVCTFILPCGRCANCARGRDDMCELYFSMQRAKGVFYDGETRLFRPDGSPLTMYSMSGLAQYAVAPATSVFPLPADLNVEEMCILGCAVPTAFSAVKNQGQVTGGQSVAVIGIGGVGSNIIQFARAMGATDVIAVDIREDKLAAARKLGATDVIDATQEDTATALKRMTNGGVDVVFEALGNSRTFASAFDGVRDGGKVVLVGLAPPTDPANFEITRLVRRSVSIVGSYGARMRNDLPQVIRMVAHGQVNPGSLITRRYSLAEAGDAYEALNRGEITGRAIVVME